MWINDKLGQMGRELCWLNKRLDRRDFPHNDKLRIKMNEDHSAVLIIALASEEGSYCWAVMGIRAATSWQIYKPGGQTI
jgi:hypothetical protein